MKLRKIFLVIAKAFFFILVLVSCTKHNEFLTIKPQIENGVFIDLASKLRSQGASSYDIILAEKNMRVEVTRGIKDALLNQYSLIHLKEKRILTFAGNKFNTIEHLDNCIQIEQNTEDTSDLHFIDRLKQCIAGFQDTHLNLSARIKTPSVNAGLLIREFGGKYYIHARHPELLNYLKQNNKDENIEDMTAIGNEVLKVDDHSPAELAKHYETFVRASSDNYRKLIADLNILYRDFDYPTKNYVSLTIKSPKKVYNYKLPWWASMDTSHRQDAKEYFQSLGIPSTDRVRILHDKDGKLNWKNIKLSFKGYFESDPIAKPNPFAPLVSFNDDDGSLAARMGIINTPTQQFCYLQLLTFSTKKLVSVNENKSDEESYVNTVKKLVTTCKSNNLSLVMDLRSNNGGNGSFPYKILSLIAKPDSKLGGKVIAYRANQVTARLVSSMLAYPELNSGDLDDIDERSFLEVQRSLPLHQLMTGILPVTQQIVPDPDIGGFSGKVLGLVTPSCVSACDGMAALLKRSERGILLGSHSNGTGAGFMSSDSIDSTYNDSNLEISLKIPNYQFGYSTHPFSSLEPMDFDSHADDYLIENQPTVADFHIDTTLDDVLGKKQTWLDAVIKNL